MTTKYGLFSEPPYLKASIESKSDAGRKEVAGAAFKGGSGPKSGKVNRLMQCSVLRCSLDFAATYKA